MANIHHRFSKAIGIGIGVLIGLFTVARFAPWWSFLFAAAVVAGGITFFTSARARQKISMYSGLDSSRRGRLGQRVAACTLLGSVLLLVALMTIRTRRIQSTKQELESAAQQTAQAKQRSTKANLEVAGHCGSAQALFTAGLYDDAENKIQIALTVPFATEITAVRQLKDKIVSARAEKRTYAANAKLNLLCDAVESKIQNGQLDQAELDLDSASNIPNSTQQDRIKQLRTSVLVLKSKHQFETARAAIQNGEFEDAEAKLKVYLQSQSTVDRGLAAKYLQAVEAVRFEIKALSLIKSFTDEEFDTFLKSSELPTRIDPTLKPLSDALIRSLASVKNSVAAGREADRMRIAEATASAAHDRALAQDNFETSESQGIPPGVSYEVIAIDVLRNVKRTIDVRLNKKVPEAILRDISLKLKSDDPQEYDTTYIFYLLPGMEVGAGAWATATFFSHSSAISKMPVVSILGATKSEERPGIPTKLRKEIYAKIQAILDTSPDVAAKSFASGTPEWLRLVEKLDRQELKNLCLKYKISRTQLNALYLEGP